MDKKYSENDLESFYSYFGDFVDNYINYGELDGEVEAAYFADVNYNNADTSSFQQVYNPCELKELILRCAEWLKEQSKDERLL
jgi:hypothetical protein